VINVASETSIRQMSGQFSSVLIIRLDHAGDCVLTVPPIAAALRARCPNSHVELLTTSHGEMLLQDDPNIDEITVYDAPWSMTPKGTPRHRRLLGAFVSGLSFALRYWIPRWRKYGVMLDLSFSPWERILTLPMGRRRLGFEGPYKGHLHRLSTRLLTDRMRFDETKHIARNCMDLLNRALPGTEEAPWTRVGLSPERKADGGRRIRDLGFDPDNVVAIHPSSEGSMKSWPLPRPFELARLLATDTEQQVLFLMSSGEYVAIAGPINELEREHSNVRHLVTRSFAELAQVVANVRLFVANDGGPMHVAAALGVPTIALFGPTDDRLYGALSPTAHVMRSQHACGRKHRPWQVDCECPGRACMADLTAQVVAGVARGVLTRPASQAHRPVATLP